MSNIEPTPSGQNTVMAHYIHVDPKQGAYTISEPQLEQLGDCKNIWRELSFLFGGISIPSIANALSLYAEQQQQPVQNSWPFFLNCLFALLTFILCFIFGMMCYIGMGQKESMVTKIKSQPKQLVFINDSSE